ncbi:2646_t:CDS:1 [Acaulospora colombiana]|uniref:2646_t:CDS:1 n=1 Tax=Acaulospora colombiana TaxID=27376 RepID=A0ACA9ND36_9GLOM|nr:2646_t:CDS:1 [Acaulospora colombiana]
MSVIAKFFSTLKESRKIVRDLLNLPNHNNTQANKFTKNDVEAFRVKIQPASEDHVIPNEVVKEIPEKYVCPRINRDMLDKAEFKVQEISDFSDRKVRTFFYKLHNVTRNIPGIPESRTDDLVFNLLNISGLDDWPLNIS